MSGSHRALCLETALPLPRILLAGIYRFVQDESFVIREPAHHFLLLLEGEMNGVNGGVRVKAHAGELVYFRPARRNRYEAPKDTVLQQVVFDLVEAPNHLRPLAIAPTRRIPPVVSLGDRFEEMRRMFDVICLELGARGPAHRLESVGALCRILALVARVLAPEAQGPTQLDPLERARMAMNEALSSQVRIGALAREAGLQVDTFIRAFKRRFGETPRAYNRGLLLCEAVRLLRESTLSIKQIALGLGWQNAKSLADNLRRRCGANAEAIRAGAAYRLDGLCVEGSPRLNVHVVPSGVARNYMDQWMFPGHVDRYSAATAHALAAQTAPRGRRTPTRPKRQGAG